MRILNIEGKRYTGVHLPILHAKNEKEYNSLLTESEKNSYIDLWKEGLNQQKAYYIDFAGRLKRAEKSKYAAIRTFVRNRHIDYMLAKENFLDKYTIIIDFRALAFTDHCGIILDFDINKNYEKSNLRVEACREEEDLSC